MEALLTALKAAAEPTRLRLLALLEHNELAVSELTQILGQSQPRVSRHLKLLAEAGLVDRFAEGTWAFYRIAEGQLATALATLLVDLIPEDDTVLARDLQRLDEIKASRAEAATAYFRDNAGEWDTLRSLYTPEGAVESAILEILGDQPIDTLVDIGTGTGRMLVILKDRIERGMGIDMSRDMLSVARANLDAADAQNCQVRLGDMYHLALEDHSADVALFHQVLHYAEDPAQAVLEASRVVRPGGRILVVDFAPHDLEELRTEHAHRRLGFSDEEVSAWLKKAGAEEVEVRHLKGGELTVTLWLAHHRAGRSLKVVEGALA
ncbi:MAG: metalloregulator ArsR/SmtB family transcription factor [Alphaproteobacteria bacterium]|nr:metalloregulator ArsR/SmtB family transcription factor [Alphaproteobacteria bacterium]